MKETKSIPDLIALQNTQKYTHTQKNTPKNKQQKNPHQKKPHIKNTNYIYIFTYKTFLG